MKSIDTILQIRLGDEYFGIDSDESNHILRVPVITSIPLSNDYLKGIVVLNGKIVPVIDLKQVLGMGSVNISQDESRIITLRINDDDIAILVDEVVDALKIDKKNYEANISEDDEIAGFYKYEDTLIQVLEPKNLIKDNMIIGFASEEIEKLSDTQEVTSVASIDTSRYLFFKAQNESFAVDIELVAELIFVPEDITPIAGTPLSNLGAITLREEVIDVLDFNLLFDFEKVDRSSTEARILILRDENRKIAICVESVEEIKDIDVSKLELLQSAIGNDKIESLYKDSKGIVSIVSSRFFRNLIEQYSVSESKDEMKEEENMNNNVIELAVFAIGNEEFAFDIESVQEIITFQEVTPVPESNEYIEGIINLRGAIIPVVNLPKKLNFNTEITEKSKIIVCYLDNEKVGFLVDDVNDIMFVEEQFVSHSKRVDSLTKSTISLDDGKRVILELRINKIISLEDLQSMKRD